MTDTAATGIAKNSGNDLIETLLEDFDCQPVLFVGAGLPRRYLNAPTWDGLLREVLMKIGYDEGKISYLWQRHNSSLIDIGSDLANLAFEWAWNAGKGHFPDEFYKENVNKDVFLKYLIAEIIEKFQENINSIGDDIKLEIKALELIRPHAIITTNYDNLMENILTGYEPIIGNSVLKYNLNAYGEVYHIHGSINDAETIVVTRNDYDNWAIDRKYFASKLLTYFVEHPIFIFGYALSDPNVRSIISDIGRYVADETGLIGNVVQVVWHSDPNYEQNESEFAIESENEQYRIRVINTNSLLNIFESLQARHELTNVNPAIVRALAARVMQLTRRDIPNGNIEVDYQTLEHAASGNNLPTMLGLTVANNINMQHPHLLSAVGKKLGYAGWHGADKLMKQIKEETGIDIRDSDNQYHCRVKTGHGAKSFSRKFSDELVALLDKVKNKEDYQITLQTS